MTWLPLAQFIVGLITTIGVGFLAIYVRAIRAEFWTKVFDEADRRYVQMRDCALLHSAEIAKLREDIGVWRVEDRHAMRNEVTTLIGNVEDHLELSSEKLQAEINRLRDKVE